MKHLVRLLLIAWPLVYGVAHAGQFACLPDATIPLKLHYETLPSSASSTLQYVAVWACKTPTGVLNQVYAFSRKEVEPYLLPFVTGKLNEADAMAVCAKKCETFRGDTSLTLAMRAISKPYLARAEVSANGDSTSRPVYRVVNGVRETTAVPNVRVAVQAGCNTNGRVGTTSYYRVDNNPNVFTADPNDTVGTGVVAACSLITPIGVNN